MQEKEGVSSFLSSPSSPQSASYSPSMQQMGTQQHLAVELADSKAKIRRLRQELWVPSGERFLTIIMQLMKKAWRGKY